MSKHREDDWISTKGGCLALTAIFFLLPPAGWIVRGWALQILWGWFVAPTFALPALGIGPAVGLSFFVGLLVPARASGGGDEEKSTTATLVTGILDVFLGPLLTVFCGWVLLHLPIWGGPR